MKGTCDMEIMLNVWKLQQYFGVAFVGLLIMMGVRKYVGNVALSLWAWAYISALGIAFAPWVMQEWIPEAWRADLTLRTNYSSAQAALMVLAMPLAALLTPSTYIVNILRVCILLESILLPVGWSSVSGASFSSALLVCAIPLFFLPGWCVAIPWILGVAMYFQGATTIACLVALIASFLWVTTTKRMKWILSPLAVVLVLSLGFIFQGHQLVDSSGRFTMWADYTKVWVGYLPTLNGIGLGAWEWFGPYVKNGTNIHYYAVHNDYLQLLFETGIVGLGLFLAVLGMTLWRVRTCPVWFPLGVSLAVCAFFYYPLHYFMGQMMAIMLFRVSRARSSGR